MIRKGKFGGMLGSSCIINPEQGGTHRFASRSMREAAVKIGLQSLYANPEETLDKYKDFDLIKAMKDRKDSKLLWVRARAIDADKVNSNGDYFSKEEIIKETDVKGEQLPAYKTFEGVPIYSNHKNDDVEEAKGMVVYAEWDEKENCVFCTFFIDEEAYPDIARGIRQGIIHDVSMGCAVGEGECSICGNIATVEKNWCDHLKNNKGKNDPKSGKLVYEKNRGIKFFELSVVGDGAFDTCEVDELYDQDEHLSYAEAVDNRLQKISSEISLAASFTPEGGTEARTAYEGCLRQVSAMVGTIRSVREAQTVGQLVGSQALGLDPRQPNSTVSNILKFLGLDPGSDLNVLDLLNLSLNFMEVSVMNLFGKKDNIDLTHIDKITKAMASLQGTMQDLLEEGAIHTGQPQRQPIQPGAQGAPAPPAPAPIEPLAPPAPQGASTGVGQIVRPQSLDMAEAGLPPRFTSVNKVLVRLADLKEVIDQNEEESSPNVSNTTGVTIMSFVKEFNHSFDAAELVYEVQAPTGERVSLASNGTVIGYIGGRLAHVAPVINDEEHRLIKEGDIKTAANKILARFIRIANDIPSVTQEVNAMEKTEPETFIQERLEEKRTNPDDDPTLEERTEPLRTNDYETTIQKGLGMWGWNSRKGIKNKIKEVLLEDSRLGTDDKTKEEMLANYRVHKCVDPGANTNKVVEALARTAVRHGWHPKEVLAIATVVAQMGPEVIGAAADLQSGGTTLPMADTPEMSMIGGLADEVGKDTSPADISDTLVSSLKELSTALKAVENAIQEITGGEGEVVEPQIEPLVPTADEAIGAEIAVKADNAPATAGSTEIMASVSSVANTMDQLGVASEDVLKSIAGSNAKKIHHSIESQRTASAKSARARNAERIKYYGFNRKASKKDVFDTLVGHLAEYADDYVLRPKNLAVTIVSMNDLPDATRELIATAHAEKNGRMTKLADSQRTVTASKSTGDTKKDRLIAKFSQLVPPAVSPSEQSAVPTSATDAGATPPPSPDANLDPLMEGVATPPPPMGGETAEAPVAPNPGDYTPGVRKPWGAVCPQCQSLNVEVAGGAGKCNDCGANLAYEFTIKVTPPSPAEDYKGNLDNKTFGEGTGSADTMEEGNPDMGLGEVMGGPMAPPLPATPPEGMGAPSTPALMGAGATPPAAPMLAHRDRGMMRISYVTDPEVFIEGQTPGGKRRPVGSVCTACASTDVDRGAKASMCRSCHNLMPFTIMKLSEMDKYEGDKLRYALDIGSEDVLISSINTMI